MFQVGDEVRVKREVNWASSLFDLTGTVLLVDSVTPGPTTQIEVEFEGEDPILMYFYELEKV